VFPSERSPRGIDDGTVLLDDADDLQRTRRGRLAASKMAITVSWRKSICGGAEFACLCQTKSHTPGMRMMSS
jgi:hypothetical protein